MTYSGWIVALTMVIGLAFPASATTLYSEAPTVYTGSTASDFDLSQFFYQRFTLSAASTIEQVTWRGEYADPSTFFNNHYPSNDNFTVAVFKDTGNPLRPSIGSPVATFQPGNGVNRTDTGIVFFGKVFQYTIPINLKLDAGNYWIAIVDNTASDKDDDWFWIGSRNTTSIGATGNTLGTAGPSFTTGKYLILDGEVSATPLPSTLPMFVAGIGFLIFVVRQKAKQHKIGLS